MVPLRLTLHNFLSYGENCLPIEFEGIHVACLCGPNGHGKSALLDAITWSLWGEARTNTADDLVRQGQASMFVDLEFLLDGQVYRVIRKRSRGKTSQSDLQFQIRAGDGQWRPLTEVGIRATQAAIIRRLRMDYETFINSAFILQGRADEFARKTAGERKRILGEILSLGIYDQLCDAARERLGHAKSSVASLDAQITQLECEHARLPELRAILEQLTAAHLAAQVEAAACRERLQEVRAERTRLDNRRKERDDLARRIALAEAGLATQQQQEAACRARLEAFGKLIARAAEIRARAQEHHAVSKERDELGARLQELRRREEARNDLQRRYQEERYRVETRAQLARQAVSDLTTRSNSLETLRKELTGLQKQVEELDRKREARAGIQQRLQELSAAAAEARAEESRFQADFKKADDTFRQLKDATTGNCPLCQGPLPPEKRLDLGRHYKAELGALKEAQGAAIQKGADAAKEAASANRELEQLEKALRAGELLRARLGQLCEQHGRAEEASVQLPEQLETLQALDDLLKRETFAPELKESLAQAETELKALRVDPARQQQIMARLAELAPANGDLHALEQAERAAPEDQRLLEGLGGIIKQARQSIQNDQVAKADADRELVRTDAVEAEERKLVAETADAEARERTSAEGVGGAREGIARREAMGPQIAALKSDRSDSAADETGYSELARAFGRNGIQALIIENALPEIESEANALLSRMSNGQFNVRLITQKSTRDGRAAETLEIRIDDGGVERPYELYSGGEAFRINFALRIALSKLLARRAGARLESLVIDEGFGSQDQEGRQRLVEAIQAVQDDFARVLVITHLEDLKDAFPTRIEVTKGVAGSQVAVY